MRVGVVGAGITGLALTHHLARRGVDVVTFETAAEPGGVIRSDVVEGHVLEYGPQRLRLSRPVEELVDDLGLAHDLLLADDAAPLYVYSDGRLREVPRSLAGFVRTDLLSWRGKLRALAEPATDPPRPDERAAEVFERKFGPEVARNVLEPLFAGTYGSDPAAMPAEYALAPLAAIEERHGSLLRAAAGHLVNRGEVPPAATFVDGLQTLPRALYDAHGRHVHLGAAVDAIRDEGGGGYVLETGSRTTAVDAVALTVPAPAAAALLADVEGARAGPLSDLAYNSLVVVHLRADADVAGFGYQVRRDGSLRTLGVTWNGGPFDRAGVFTAFLGGMTDPGIQDLPAEEVAAVASREFETVMGVAPSVLDVTPLPDVLPAYDASWHALDALALPDDVALATNYTDRLGVGARVGQARRVADRFAGRT